MDYIRIFTNSFLIFAITTITAMATGNPNSLIPTASAILTGLIAGLTELKLDFDRKGQYKNGIIDLSSPLFTSKLLLV